MKKRLGFLIVCLAGLAMTGCGRSPETETSAGDAQTTPAAPAAPAAPKPSHATYSLQWVSNDVPASLPAGKPASVKVSVKNTGDWPWNDPFTANPSKPDGTYAVRLTYSWVGADGKALPPDAARGELKAPVPPGGTADYVIKVAVPKDPGNYKLQFDLVEELVFFFSAKGPEKLTVPVIVQ
jgi:hypothetical protein